MKTATIIYRPKLSAQKIKEKEMILQGGEFNTAN